MKKSRPIIFSTILLLVGFSCTVPTISEYEYEYEYFKDHFSWKILYYGNSLEPTWTTSGDAVPFIQSREFYSNGHSIQLGSLESGEICTLSMPIELIESSILSFWVKADRGRGKLHFYSDNSKLLSTEVQDQWTKYEYILPPGVHSLKWQHDKSFYGSYGSSEQAWIDQIEIKSNTLQNFPILLNGSPMDKEWEFKGVLPSLQSEVFHQGGDAMQLGTLDRHSFCSLETSISISEKSVLSFWLKVDAGDGYIQFIGNSNTLLRVEQTDQWSKYEFPISPGVHELKWQHIKHSNNGVKVQAWIDSIEINTLNVRPIDNFPIMKNGIPMDIHWSTSGSFAPFLQTNTVYQGEDAVQLDVLSRSGESFMETTISVTEPCKLSFWAKAGSGGGLLNFYLDGSWWLSVDRLEQWTKYEYNLSPGNHTIKWSHDKYYDDWLDQAWIDQIEIYP